MVLKTSLEQGNMHTYILEHSWLAVQSKSCREFFFSVLQSSMLLVLSFHLPFLVFFFLCAHTLYDPTEIKAEVWHFTLASIFFSPHWLCWIIEPKEPKLCIITVQLLWQWSRDNYHWTASMFVKLSVFAFKHASLSLCSCPICCQIDGSWEISTFFHI